MPVTVENSFSDVPGHLSPDDRMDLLLATILYKQDRRIRSNTELCRRAHLKCGRHSLPRFLGGDTDDFEQSTELQSFLQQEGYWPYNNSTNIAYSFLSQFIRNELRSHSRTRLQTIMGRYEAYQWSSTKHGMVTIANFEIFPIVDSQSVFSLVKESQRNIENDKGENYEGCCIYSDKKLVFILRETTQKRVKLAICDEINGERICGFILKSSSRKPIHLSNIFLKKVDKNYQISPRIDYFDNCDATIKNWLKDPITPFDLTDDRLYKKLKLDFQKIMDEVIQRPDE